MFLLSCPFVNLVFAQTSQELYQGQLIDVHEHYVLSSGSSTGIWNSESDVISQMDQAGIAKMVAFAELRYIGSLKKYADRLIPFHMFAMNILADDPKVVELTRQALDSGFDGIGELLLRRDLAINVVADNPVAKQIVDLAAGRGVVINAHQGVNTPVHGPEMISEFERLLDHDKNVKIIWAHAGYAAPSDVSKLMAKHSNLYADLSARTSTPPQGIGRALRFKIGDEKGTVDQGWRELLEKFPDRFMYGTDKGGRTEGFTSDFLIVETAYFRKILGGLSLDLAERIGYVNIQKVMKLGQPTNLSISLDCASASVGSQVKISGKLVPAMKGVTVALTYSAGGQVKKAILKTDVDGSFAESVRLDRNGEWNFAASTPGAIGWIGSESNSVMLLVQEQTQQTTTEPVKSNETIGTSPFFNETIMLTAVVAVVAITALTFKMKRRKSS